MQTGGPRGKHRPRSVAAVQRSAEDARRGHFWCVCMFLLVLSHATHMMPIPALAESPNWLASRLSEELDACARLGVPIVGVTHHEYIEVEPTAAGARNSGAILPNSV